MITVTSLPTPPIPVATPLVADETPSSSASAAPGGLSFGDVVDALNPLQHIPVISGAVRALTGSTISSASEIAGDALYGTLMGSVALSVAASASDVAVTQLTGKSLGQNVLGALGSITGSGNAAVSTALVADPQAVSQALAAQQASSQAVPSVADTLASTASASAFFKSLPGNAGAAQYQRAQTLDAANKMLMKIAV